MLAAFDSVDDTKLLSKAVINEIIGDGKEETGKISEIFASEKAGRKVLLYLLGRYIILLYLVRVGLFYIIDVLLYLVINTPHMHFQLVAMQHTSPLNIWRY